MISPDGEHVYVDERNTGARATRAATSPPRRRHLRRHHRAQPRRARRPAPRQDPMPAAMRDGQFLFNTANSSVVGITQNFWVACASCHIEGRTDAVTWRFLPGPRDTPSNAGRRLGHRLPLPHRRPPRRDRLLAHHRRGAGRQFRELRRRRRAVRPQRSTRISTTSRPTSTSRSLRRSRRPPTRRWSRWARDLLQRGRRLRQLPLRARAHRLGRGRRAHAQPRGPHPAPRRGDVQHGGLPRRESHRRGRQPALPLRGTVRRDVSPTGRSGASASTRPPCAASPSSPPYFHDGSAPTIYDALEMTKGNAGGTMGAGHMGDITSLTSAQIDALVEYVRSL